MQNIVNKVYTTRDDYQLVLMRHYSNFWGLALRYAVNGLINVTEKLSRSEY